MTGVRRRPTGAVVALLRRGLGSTGLIALLLSTLLVGFLGATLHPRLLLLFPALVVLLATGVVWPWLATLFVRGHLHFATQRIHEGEQACASLHLRHYAAWPAWGLVFEIDAANRHLLDTLPPFSSATRSLALRPRQRGVFPTRSARLRTGFPFGLLTASRCVTVSCPLVVWPRVLPVACLPDWAGADIAMGHVETRRVGSTGDTVGVREYRRGDPMRGIHWPQTARHECFMVREFQASGVPRIRIVLDCNPDVHAGQGSDSSFEWAVRIAASLASSWLAAGAEVELLAGSLRLPPAGGHRQRALVLDALAYAQPHHTVTSTIVRRSEPATVFVSTDLGWRRRAEAARSAWRGFMLRSAGFGGSSASVPVLDGKCVAVDHPDGVPAALLRMQRGLADVA